MLIVLPNELEILRTMQPLDRDVFHYLAERVDYESGIIGRARRVSYGGMAFDLSERDSHQGRKKEALRTVTSKQVINAVSRLVKVGLFRRDSKKGVGEDLILLRVFWAHELNTPNSEQKEVGSKLVDNLALLLRLFDSKNNGLQENQASSWDGGLREVGITSFTHHQQQENEKFTMALDWLPTANEFEMILHRAGKKKEDIKQDWIAEFIGYWHAEGNRRYSQKEWTYRLAARMVDYLRDPALFDRLRGSAPITAKTGTAGKSKAGLPEWANPPQDNDKLGAWMRQHGYGDGPPGMQLFQTRAWLRQAIEIKLKDYRRLS